MYRFVGRETISSDPSGFLPIDSLTRRYCGINPTGDKVKRCRIPANFSLFQFHNEVYSCRRRGFASPCFRRSNCKCFTTANGRSWVVSNDKLDSGSENSTRNVTGFKARFNLPSPGRYRFPTLPMEEVQYCNHRWEWVGL